MSHPARSLCRRPGRRREREVCIGPEGIERRFRLRKAKLDRYGLLDVRASSDSLLTHRAIARTLFDQDEPEEVAAAVEQWVVAYLMNPVTRTLMKVSAALPVGVRNAHPPFRLILDNVVPIPLTTPTPPAFRGGEDDLNLGDEAGEEGSGGKATG